MRSVAAPAVGIVRQLHDWAARNGVMLFPRAYAFPTITGTLATATRSAQPDGAFVCHALIGFSGFELTNANNRITIDTLKSGARLLKDGTLRVGAFLNTLESDAVSASFLVAPIGVFPGDSLSYSVSCEIAGDSFAGGSGNNYETAMVGYGLHDAASGAQLSDERGRAALLKLLSDLGELRVLGVAGANTAGSGAIDQPESPALPMTAEIVAAQGLAPATVTSARMNVGLHELLPQAFSAAQTLLAWRAPSVVINPGTQVRIRVQCPVGAGTVRPHAAIAGRNLGT